jgi:hypothetical protein
MANTSTPTVHKNELLDSLLHNDKKRMVFGVVCGLISGCIMLFITTFFAPEGAGPLWWLQLTASICYGGEASILNPPSSIIMSGALWHFGVSAFLGLLFGKMTLTTDIGKLLAYGLVLGGICWLGSNMFAPDFLNVHALGAVKEWTRMFFFQSFTLSMAVLMAIATSSSKSKV